MSDHAFSERSPLDAEAFKKFSDEAEAHHGGNSAAPPDRYDWEPSKEDEEYFEQARQEAREKAQKEEHPPYTPKGHSPVWFRKRGVIPGDIVVGNGFLELGTAGLLASSSGVGKSSIAMQTGCCWSCGHSAFYLDVPRPLRIVMIQNEDSDNDLARQSAVIEHLGLDEKTIDHNFLIETVRGKIGAEAVRIMRDLVKFWRADLLIINPLSAYHEGDISQNKDNIKFLYGELGRLLDEKICAIFALHHKTKPPKNNGQKPNKKPEDVYFEIMYDLLGGSTLTNFFRGLITVSAIGNSEVFKFAMAKRFRESGWDQKFEMFKWHEDRDRYLWVPAGFAEAEKAAAGKTIDDLRELVPILGTIPKDTLELESKNAGFTRIEYRGALAQALDESTPDSQRLYQWAIYNPTGRPSAAIGRSDQPDDERPDAIKERRQAADKAARTAARTTKSAKTAGI
jgi:AAA domain